MSDLYLGLTFTSDQQPEQVKSTTMNTPVFTVQTDINTVLSDYDTLAAAIAVITGDTYSAVTHQFTFGGSTGLTHAQWAGASIGQALNTAVSVLLTAQTDAATALSGTANSGSDLEVHIKTASNPTQTDAVLTMQAIERYIVDGRFAKTGLPL